MIKIIITRMKKKPTRLQPRVSFEIDKCNKNLKNQ